MDQDLRRLGPRIKLFKRHLLEWNELLACQKEVRRLSHQKANGLLVHHEDARLVRIQEVTIRGILLTQVAARQLEERQRMKARHEQEEADLEFVMGI